MNPSRAPEKGEVVKLGPPSSGEVVLAADPAAAGSAFAAGTQTLLPGAQIPIQKHLDRETVWFILKGQGRATVGDRVINVVPGAMLYVPRGAWHGLRNTGTGALQVAWVSAPPGLEVFFRDLSRLGASPSTQALQELAQRHRIEFRQAAEARAIHAERSAGTERVSADAPLRSGSGRRRGRRGGRRRGRGGRGGGGPRAAAPVAPQARREEAAPAPVVPAPARPSASPRPGSGRPRSSRRPSYRRRVKEVYMGGRWIQVEGEGPVIAPGRQRLQGRASKPGTDDEPPAIGLSVQL